MYIYFNVIHCSCYLSLKATCMLQTFSATADFSFKIFVLFIFIILHEDNCNWLRELFKECFSSSEFTPLWLQAAVEQWKESKHFGLYCNNYHFKM